MSELFLIASSNGNGESFMLVLSGSNNCTKQFTARTIEAMAQFLGDEHFADVQENLINYEELPCTNCTKQKKCSEMRKFILIDQETVKKMLNLVSEEHGEDIREYLERED